MPMSLSDEQIERYSRQIIVPGFGGSVQERLLDSQAAIVAAPADALAAALYLAGAGVGRILIYPAAEQSAYRAIVERAHDLNGDVRVEIVGKKAEELPHATTDLVLALISNAATAAIAERLFRAQRAKSAIVARLDAPGKIAILPIAPPCPLCAEANVLTAAGGRAANAGLFAMTAVTESLRVLAGMLSAPRLIEFAGFTTSISALARRPAESGAPERCGCEMP